MKIIVPQEVADYIRKVFQGCNDYLTGQLSNFPGTREDSLDQQFVAKMLENSGPRKLPCNWTVRIESYYIGGGRHYNRWEVADVGIMLFFRNRGRIVRSKLVMLQSKKLYASSSKHVAEDPYLRNGLGRLLESESEHIEKSADKTYLFKKASRYRAFRKDDTQQETMGHFQTHFKTELYYLFYNPAKIPRTIKSPLDELPDTEVNLVGCRVLPKHQVDEAIKPNSANYSPSYSDLVHFTDDAYFGEGNEGGWRLENFVADLLLGCKVGIIDDTENFRELQNIMRAKTSPMSTAISVTFDSEDINLSQE